METTVLIAKVLGVYFAVSGIFVITHKKTLMLVLKDLFEHRAISFLAGIALVFGGATLVLRGNTGTDYLSLFVMVMSWAILIKGIVYIFAPEQLHAMVKKFPVSTMPLVGALITAIGLYLVFFL